MEYRESIYRLLSPPDKPNTALTPEHKEQLYQLLSSPDEANVALAIEIVKGIAPEINLEEILTYYRALYCGIFGNKSVDIQTQITELNRPRLGVHLDSFGYFPEHLVGYPHEIQKLPENFTTLTHLEELDLSWVNLKELPENFGDLNKLQKLNLSQNALSSLPESLGKLAHLQILDLYYNKLSSLPKSFKNLKKMTLLQLEGNPLPGSEIQKIKALLPNCQVVF